MKLLLFTTVLLISSLVSHSQSGEDTLTWKNLLIPPDLYKYPIVFVKGFFSPDSSIDGTSYYVRINNQYKKSSKKIEKYCLEHNYICVDRYAHDTLETAKYPYLITVYVVENQFYEGNYYPCVKIYDRLNHRYFYGDTTKQKPRNPKEAMIKNPSVERKVTLKKFLKDFVGILYDQNQSMTNE